MVSCETTILASLAVSWKIPGICAREISFEMAILIVGFAFRHSSSIRRKAPCKRFGIAAVSRSRIAPASVMVTRRVVRSNSFTPSLASALEICRLRAL